jgi:hypothetical protein
VALTDPTTVQPSNHLEVVMRMLLNAVIDTEAGNEAARTGALGT